jgi:protein-S-isoprenylcysteine O-methyltransferase Ste14
MMPTDDSQQCQDQAQLSLPVSNRHLLDLVTVNLANVGALALSLSEIEQWVRVTGCLLAAVFTALKIVETIRALKK